MGELINMTCQKCGYDQDLFLGNGFLDHDIDNIISRFPISVAEQIRIWLKSNLLKSYDINSRLAFCHNCNTYKAVPVLNLISKDGNQESFGLHCNKCNELLEFINPFSKEQHYCKNCNGEISFTNTGSWD